MAIAGGAMTILGGLASSVASLLPDEHRFINTTTVAQEGDFRNAGRSGSFYAGYDVENSQAKVIEQSKAGRILQGVGTGLQMGGSILSGGSNFGKKLDTTGTDALDDTHPIATIGEGTHPGVSYG